MKYMQNGGFQGHPLMRLTLFWTLIFMAGLWLTNGFMYFSRMNLKPSSVKAYYLGSAEEYSQPRSAASMLEVTHTHLPIMAIIILMLTHLMIFAPYSEQTKRWFISTVFLMAFAGEGSGWLVRFVHPGFAWLKVFCFVLLEAALGLLIIGLAVFLLKSAENQARHRKS